MRKPAIERNFEVKLGGLHYGEILMFALGVCVEVGGCMGNVECNVQSG
jgi:hypothetical protein